MAARALQGLGAAIVSPAVLSVVVTAFTEPAPRTRAMGIYGLVSSGGGAVGVLLGGVLVGTLGWPWIFLVNVPIGLAVLALCRPPTTTGAGHRGAVWIRPAPSS